MERKKEITFRTLIVIVGVIAMIYAAYNIYINLQTNLITELMNNNSISNYDISKNYFDFILILLSYILIIIGTKWSNILNSIGGTCISFAVIFLTLTITIYPFYTHTDELTNSLQPSIDYIVAGSFDKVLYEQIEIANKTDVNLILNGNTQIITIGEINAQNTDLIWKELGFNDSVSYETKSFTINLLLTLTYNEMKKSNLQSTPIPVNLLGKFIEASNQTKDLKKIIEYDFFNTNLTLRQENLEKLRNDCENKKIISEELCTPILMTRYDNIMENISNTNNSIISTQMSSTIQNLETIDKLNDYLKEKMSIWKTFAIITILLFIIGIIAYYLHFKFIVKNKTRVEIVQQISKLNLINYIPSYILLIFLYFILIGNYLINTISNMIPEEYLFTINLVMTSPMFLVLENIFLNMIIISTIYLLLSLLIFGISYYLFKKNHSIE